MHFLFQWYLGYLDCAITLLLSNDNILDDIVKGTTFKPKKFLCCFKRSNNYH